MEGFDLPMSFGKKAKAPAKVKPQHTKREEPARPAIPPPREVPRAEPGPSRPAADAVAKADDSGDDDIGPKPPSPAAKRKAEDEDGDDSDESEYEEEADRTPVTHEIVLKDHTKLVSALAVEPSGARVATGSHDYDCKLWDFGGMDQRLRPFKSFEPNGSYFIHDLSYAPDGKHLLVVSGTFYPKVFDRDGGNELEFAKGDVYLRDMKVTKGHTAEINSGAWHPSDNDVFLTAANDSTLRIWEVSNRQKQKHVIVVRSKERGNKTHVTACAWSPDGKLIAGGCLDGALHIWRTNGNFARPDKSNEAAHAKNTETTAVAFSPDNTKLVSRGADDTIKLWDVKNLRQPLAVHKDEANVYSETGVAWSPDGKYVLIGTAVDPRKEDAIGEVLFLSATDLSVERRVPIAKGASVVRVVWHSRINQIFASLSNGAVYVLYSPHSSIHGALLPLAKMPRTKARDVSYTTADLTPVIYTPDAGGLGGPRLGMSAHQREKRAKKFKPTEPVHGVGKGGRIGASATAGFVAEMFASGARVGLEDPREALLKYATEEEKERKKYMADEAA
ncbi:WD repeat-containing protein 70 [Vanrija pseudolonga]|uniref:WD repeat-containing protein 70 n=1 Tax=Vanrija pseudolonga TaxID=143232 RepID=A0AAF0Y407_9TREE|nr:WD repeat-containing protein 70 [Vanrija pseudolonga]